jgi:hypothetical protein
VANEIAETSTGMMIAIPEGEWDGLAIMSTADMAATRRELADRVRLEAMRKSPWGPKKPRSQHDGSARQGHVSTAKLLVARHG